MNDDNSKRVTTSIKIDPNIWKEAKIEAIRQNMDLSELVERALAKELGKKTSTILQGGKLKGGRL